MIDAAAATQKEKCQYGGCEHTVEVLGEEVHSEGVCWKITKPELEKEETYDKYCPCKREVGLLRRFEITGFMEPEKYDMMVTKKCEICFKLKLIRVDEDLCSACLNFQRYL